MRQHHSPVCHFKALLRLVEDGGRSVGKKKISSLSSLLFSCTSLILERIFEVASTAWQHPLSYPHSSIQAHVILNMASHLKNGRMWCVVSLRTMNPFARLPLIMACPARQSGVFSVLLARKEQDKPFSFPCLSLRALERDAIYHGVTLLITCSRVAPVHVARQVLQPSQYVSGLPLAHLPWHVPHAMSANAGT